MKPKLPDISNMLPSAARKALEDYFYERITAGGSNYRGGTKYSFADALLDTGRADEYTKRIMDAAYYRALDRWYATAPSTGDFPNGAP